MILRLIAILLTLSATAHAATLNVRDFGAAGDGKTDDTAAIRKTFKQLSKPDVGKLVIPAGKYRITETIDLDYKVIRNVVITGEGAKTRLFWAGPEGGTLLRFNGMGNTQIRDLTLDGGGRAGILFHAISGRSGNLNNHFSDVIFSKADVGIQFGEKPGDHTNADVVFTKVRASHLGTFFISKNDQAVDFLFNHLFAMGCDTVFDFQRGGNLVVNIAQMTACGLFLNIEGGGRNAGTFILTNVRHEQPRSYKAGRDQILKATNIKWDQALVKFIGFDDCQWSWFSHESDRRWKPLCEIGPGVNVVFESSIFNGPIATVTGKDGKPGSIVLRECTYGFILPNQAIKAGPHGYVRSENCFNDFMVPLPDLIKWPDLPAMRVDADGTLEPRPVIPPTKGAQNAIDAVNAFREAWVEELTELENR